MTELSPAAHPGTADGPAEPDARESGDRASEALHGTRQAQLAVRLALSCTVEPQDRTLAPLLRGLDPFQAWELVRTNAGGRFERCVGRVRELRLDALMDRTDKIGARVTIPGDPGWPTALNDLTNPPYCLWVTGSLDLATDCTRSLSLVGARAATPYGVHVAGDLAYGMAQHGFAVVSGAAFGIDTAGHRGALAADGRTIAVMACGIDIAYPKANAGLLDEIAAHGAVISELPPGCAPHKQRFLSRNRLIAALSPGTVVVEAGLRSGSRSTAAAARDLGRLVAAVPGPVTSAASAGTHQLIRDGDATLISDVAECVDLFGAIGDDLAPVKRGRDTLLDRLDEAGLRTLDATPLRRAATVEHIAVTAGLAPREVLRSLAALHAEDLVERCGDTWRHAQR